MAEVFGTVIVDYRISPNAGTIGKKPKKMTVYNVQFTSDGKTYSYISDKDSFNVGDVVIVCAGKDNHEAAVRIVSRESSCEADLSVPVEKLKHILRAANEEERVVFAKTKKANAKKPSRSSHIEPESNNRPYETDGLQPDGSLVVSYADYGSEFFGGMDVEVIYKLAPGETEKLRAFLAERYVGSIESMLMQECGQNFMKRGPMELFEEAGVKYEKFVWIS